MSTTSLYARSDIVSVWIPPESGGCGSTHTRPVDGGKPEPEWRLDCPACTAYLKKVRDPLWAAMPADIPETPDERTIREDAEKRGERALKKSQEEINVKLAETTVQIAELLARHDGPAPDQADIAALVAAEVAKLMEQRDNTPVVPEPVPAPVQLELFESEPMDLSRLHRQTLAKMCRERDLDDTGGKEQLLARLTA